MTKKSQLWDHTDFFFLLLSYQISVFLLSCIEHTYQCWVFGDLAAPRPPSSMQNSVTITAVFYSHEDANVGDGSGSGEV